MILVTLGTQDAPFPRLLQMVDELIETLDIKEEVIAQIGFTQYQPKHFKTYTYLPKEEYLKIYQKADLIIAHGGAGTIFEAMKNGKKMIVVPRLGKYKEHVDDHQIEISKKLGDGGYIIYCQHDLKEAYLKVNDFVPRGYDFSNDIASRIREFIK